MDRRTFLATTTGLLTASSAGCLRLSAQETGTATPAGEGTPSAGGTPTQTATPSESGSGSETVEVDYIDAESVNNRERDYALDIKLGTVENVTGDDVYIVAAPVNDSHSEFGGVYFENGEKRTLNANDDLEYDEDITLTIYETDARNNTLAAYRFDSTDGRFEP